MFSDSLNLPGREGYKCSQLLALTTPDADLGLVEIQFTTRETWEVSKAELSVNKGSHFKAVLVPGK